MLLPSAGLLAPTKTHAARRWLFATNVEATTPGLGVLTIVQGRRDVASYAIGFGERGRVVVLLRQGPTAERHAVTLPAAGKPATCTCDGFRFNGHCKHADAITSMLAAGVLTRTTPVRLEAIA